MDTTMEMDEFDDHTVAIALMFFQKFIEETHPDLPSPSIADIEIAPAAFYNDLKCRVKIGENSWIAIIRVKEHPAHPRALVWMVYEKVDGIETYMFPAKFTAVDIP